MTRLRRLPAVLAVVVLLLAACGGSDVALVPDEMPVDPPALQRRDVGPPQLNVLAPAAEGPLASPVRVEVSVDNFELTPKGLARDGEGLFHVIVDEPCVEAGDLIGEEHIRMDTGDATVDVDLSPGTHELCVQLGDGFHTALAVTRKLTVEVADEAPSPGRERGRGAERDTSDTAADVDDAEAGAPDDSTGNGTDEELDDETVGTDGDQDPEENQDPEDHQDPKDDEDPEGDEDDEGPDGDGPKGGSCPPPQAAAGRCVPTAPGAGD